MGAVERVGKAQVERARLTTLPVQLLGADPVDAFRRLPVAFAQLGAQASRPEADWIDAKQLEAAPLQQPQLQLGLGLEDTDQHRAAGGNALLGEPPIAIGDRVWRRWAGSGDLRLADRRR